MGKSKKKKNQGKGQKKTGPKTANAEQAATIPAGLIESPQRLVQNIVSGKTKGFLLIEFDGNQNPSFSWGGNANRRGIVDTFELIKSFFFLDQVLEIRSQRKNQASNAAAKAAADEGYSEETEEDEDEEEEDSEGDEGEEEEDEEDDEG